MTESSTPAPPTSAARQRILDTAYRLFYEQGINRTGVNQIIAEAAVTKATFYNHFPSKTDLAVAYAKMRDQLEWDEIHAGMAQFKSPRDRFLGPLLLLYEWLKATDFNGCSFHQLVFELPGRDHPAWAYAVKDKEEMARWLRGLTIEFSNSRDCPQPIEIDDVTRTYTLVFEGALALTKIHGTRQPVDDALTVMRKLTGLAP